MGSDHDRATLRKRETTVPAPQPVGGRANEARLPDLGGAAPAVLRMQQTYGNRVTRRLIQRDDTSPLPPVPSYQLRPPSLLQPEDPADRYHLLGNYQLHLDPQIQAMIDQHLNPLLDPGNVRAALANLRLGALPAMQTPGANPLTGPGVPQSGPLVPAGAGPATPRAASMGDLMDAVLAIPAVDQAVTRLRTRATDQVARDWHRLRTGEQVAAVSTVAVIGLGALGGAMTDPQTRQLLLDQLNGRILPVPGVDWLHVETNLGGDNLMFGLHLDVGRLLPPSLGFGPGSPTAIGGPPQPQPFEPGTPTH